MSETSMADTTRQAIAIDNSRERNAALRAAGSLAKDFGLGAIIRLFNSWTTPIKLALGVKVSDDEALLLLMTTCFGWLGLFAVVVMGAPIAACYATAGLIYGGIPVGLLVHFYVSIRDSWRVRYRKYLEEVK